MISISSSKLFITSGEAVEHSNFSIWTSVEIMLNELANSWMRFKVLRVQELFVGPACSLLPFNDEPSQPIIAFEAVPVDPVAEGVPHPAREA